MDDSGKFMIDTYVKNDISQETVLEPKEVELGLQTAVTENGSVKIEESDCGPEDFFGVDVEVVTSSNGHEEDGSTPFKVEDQITDEDSTRQSENQEAAKGEEREGGSINELQRTISPNSADVIRDSCQANASELKETTGIFEQSAEVSQCNKDEQASRELKDDSDDVDRFLTSSEKHFSDLLSAVIKQETLPWDAPEVNSPSSESSIDVVNGGTTVQATLKEFKKEAGPEAKAKKCGVKKPVKTERRGVMDPSSSLYLIPFNYNWRREIVYRAPRVDRGPGKKFDVYYYSPTGKKLRSVPDIIKYLEASKDVDVNAKMFTFGSSKISDSPLEITRFAKTKAPWSPNDTLPEMNTMSKKPKLTKLGNRKPSKSPQSVKPTKSPQSVKPTKSPQSVKPTKSTQRVKPVHQTPKKIHDKNTNKGIPPKCYTVAKNHDRNSNEGIPKCSKDCPGQEGRIPSIQCKACYCLFHPACVGIHNRGSNHLNFICKDCLTMNNVVCEEMPSPPPPLPSSQPFNPAVFTPTPINVAFGGSIANTTSSPRYLITTSNNLNVFQNVNYVVQTLPQLSVSNPPFIQFSNQAESVRVSSEKMMKSIEPLVPPSTQFAMPKIINTFTMVPGGMTAPYGGPTFFSACDSGQSSIASTEFSLAQNTLGNVSLPTNSQISGPTNPVNCDGLRKSNVSRRPLVAEHSYLKRNVFIPSKLSNTGLRKQESVTLGTIETLHGGFESLLKIFSYLKAPDLLKAARVCRTWKRVASHPSLWKVVVLKNSRIISWKMLARCVQMNESWYLDLRGIICSGAKSEMWAHLESAIKFFKSLTHLHLGEVPVSLIHTIGTYCFQLKYLSAEFLVVPKQDQQLQQYCPLNFFKISKLQSLETLKLRGVMGIHLTDPLPLLECLTNLKEIRHLALTSLKGIKSPDFQVLRSLIHLTTLELGDCTLWNEKSYEIIGSLHNVEKLRLEFGGRSAERGLTLMLTGLKRLIHLDLILFQIPVDLGCVLSELKALRTLNIWPDLSFAPARNNYNTLKALERVPFLKSFTWGLIRSSLVGQSQESFDPKSSCVPILVNDAITKGAPFVLSKITANCLMMKLQAALPSSKIIVMMVPNSFYTTIHFSPG